MRRFFFFAVIFLIALFAVSRVSAAPQSKGLATLTGTILGPDDRPVPHASVSYQSSSGSVAPHAVFADSHGHFTIPKLKADNYDLRASGKGVFSEWQKNISLRSGQTKSITLRLIYAKQIPKAYVKSTPSQPPQ
ncbi:MAG TPA: carboxypeptidase-like regulatory domain-containing protein [Candidatus Acidoferrum sp.]|nr:carboxypeptidase-like regulatory domain-containing protein [Candidatus Acidoferrum sp.]